MKEAAAVIRGGGTVIFPTEMVYGLGAMTKSVRCRKSIGQKADLRIIL